MKKLLLIGALSAASVLALGCRQNNYDDRGVGGSGNVEEPRLGEGDLGRGEGTVDDGEPRFEVEGEAGGQIGDRPGVDQDGQRRIEERRDRRLGDQPGGMDDTVQDRID